MRKAFRSWRVWAVIAWFIALYFTARGEWGVGLVLVVTVLIPCVIMAKWLWQYLVRVANDTPKSTKGPRWVTLWCMPCGKFTWQTEVIVKGKAMWRCGQCGNGVARGSPRHIVRVVGPSMSHSWVVEDWQVNVTFKKAPKAQGKKGKQGELRL